MERYWGGNLYHVAPRNYYIKNDKAYTEDHITIYNLYVHKIPRAVTEAEIFEYFSSFGKVLKARVITDRKRQRRSSPKMGFVYFDDSLIAAKVLLHPAHIIKSERIAVKACDSWHQPMADKATADANVTKLSSASDCSEVESDIGACGGSKEASGALVIQLGVLHLNDDCLEHICKMMELSDQVSFARTCQRFRGVFQMVCKISYKELNLENLETLTLWQTRDFLQMAGPFIEKLAGSLTYKNRDRVIEFICVSCRRVKSLTLISSKVRNNLLRKMLEKLSDISHLELNDCSLTDNSILAMGKMQKLESLSVKLNYELTGKHLYRLQSLKELNLYGCGNLQSSHLVDICRSLKDLKLLDIGRCERLTSEAFNELAVNLLQLETLHLSCYSDVHYEKIAHLPKLKHIDIYVCPLMSVRSQLFVALTERKSEQLESLHLMARNWLTYERAVLISYLTNLKRLVIGFNDGLTDACMLKLAKLTHLEELTINNCTQVSGEGMLNVLKACKHLKEINIQRCTGILNPFVFDAIQVLKDRKGSQTPNGPLIIYCCKSGINEYIFDDERYIAATQLIKLSFKYAWNEDDSYFDDDYYDDEYDIDFEDDDDDHDDDYLFDGDDAFFGMVDEYSDGDGDDDDIEHAFHVLGQFGEGHRHLFWI